MVDHIKCTMTDRCVVNQAAVRLVNEQWKKQIHVLFCNLHPLDTIASDVKKCLHRLECDSNVRQLSKSGCVVEQILAAFDRLRY